MSWTGPVIGKRAALKAHWNNYQRDNLSTWGLIWHTWQIIWE